MKITFNGIKNIAYYEAKCKPYDAFSSDKVINMELTDDINGNDLTTYKKVIKKCSNSNLNYENSVNQNFLNVELFREADCENDEIAINGKPVNNLNNIMPLAFFISAATKKISQTPENKFIVEENHLMSDDTNNGILLGTDISKIYGDASESIMDFFHYPQRVKKGAEGFSNDLMTMMTKHFDVFV